MTAAPRLQDQTSPARRRPRIALLGEFSAGKSTLANLLLGQSVSPVKVTATQLPPVWYSFGSQTLLRIGNDGVEEAIAPEALDRVSHRETQAVRIGLDAEVLDFCDVIDMPGTSDPNMPQAVWDRMLARADGAIWCTSATQAWRQSEAALWDSLPERLHQRSLLLITRMDTLKDEKERARVTARVRREAGGLFRKVLPISLTDALSDPENPDLLERCGADLFVENLVELVEEIAARGPTGTDEAFAPIGKPVASTAPPVRPVPASADEGEGIVPRRVVPRRIRRAGLTPGEAPRDR